MAATVPFSLIAGSFSSGLEPALGLILAGGDFESEDVLAGMRVFDREILRSTLGIGNCTGEGLLLSPPPSLKPTPSGSRMG